jgi:3-oxoacyl-[acyl-carrier-protein] synthase-1
MKSKSTENSIWVTGMGLISALGNNVQENLSSLAMDRSGIGPITMLDSLHKKDYVAGEVNLSNEQLSTRSNSAQELPRTTLLALHAAKEALQHAGLDSSDYRNAGIILGTTVGGMDKTEKLYLENGDPRNYISSHHCGFTTQYVASALGISNYMNTISTACSSGANAIMLGARMIRMGLIDIVLAGGSDSLSKFTFNGFRTLMILDPEPCKPFSAQRKGLNLGEGAGFVVLESEEHARARGAEGLAVLSGFGNCNDAFHQTASSPDGRGPYRAMSEALASAGLDPVQIDYINVHGTGTDNNDLTEGIAIQRLFGDNPPFLSSTKSSTGHCLGAAGAIEAVFSILAIQHSQIYATLRFGSPVEGTGLIPVTRLTPHEVCHVLSNSFGFGGCDTSLLFSRIPDQK